ncbi:hypothetical protein CAEBREN_02455 [Caenorhabditis brenneri]|uniref:MATH domain-containing protein n=1 Tax=Caenorhabditis brenneri TaxID=135651 RepID=G0MV36_CAEBE|nr:hypothetical protein CAEBREN_02455 [Caenorhabditis brenneri]
MSGTVDKLSPVEKVKHQKTRSFVLKHLFKNVSKMKDPEDCYSSREDHFGVSWFIAIWHEKITLGAFFTVPSLKAKKSGRLTLNLRFTFFIQMDIQLIRPHLFFIVSKKVLDTNFHLDMSGTIVKLPTAENKTNQKTRSFVLKHLFKKVSKMKDAEHSKSPIEDHFGVPWSLGIVNYKDHLGVFLYCAGPGNKTEWSIDTEFEIQILYPNGNPAHKDSAICHCFARAERYGRVNMMTWEKMKEEYLVNDELVVKIPVKITKMTGIEKYLEMLYGEDALDDDTVEGILQLAKIYDTKTLVRRCEEYLLEVSRKTLKEKLELSVKYKLVELKKKCMSEIETDDDVRSVILERIRDMDHNTLANLLEKTLALK